MLRYREIYNYVADSRLPGNANMQKKIAGEAANYVVVNGLLFKIAQHKESGKWTHYLLLVIPEKFKANILNMYHNSLLAMHEVPYHTFLTMRKQFYFPQKYKNTLKHEPYANEQSRKIQNNDHITAVYQLNISHVKI